LITRIKVWCNVVGYLDFVLAQQQTQPTKLMAAPSQAWSGKGLTGLSLALTSRWVWTQNLFRAHGLPDRAYTNRSWAIITHEVQFLIFKGNFLVQFCNTSSRLVTLCKSCHKKEKNDNEWPKCWDLHSSSVCTMHSVYHQKG
jgi:hypothetical protein